MPMAKPWGDHILIQQVCSFSISQSKFNNNKAILLWHNILIQTNSSQRNKMQKLPILHLVREMNPWHEEFISRALSKPASRSMEFSLSPVIAFLVPVSSPGSSYLHIEDTSGFGVFWRSTVQQCHTLPPVLITVFSTYIFFFRVHPSKRAARLRDYMKKTMGCKAASSAHCSHC